MNNKRWQLALCLLTGALAGSALTATIGGGLRIDGTQPAQIVAAALAIFLAAYLVFRNLGKAALNLLSRESGLNHLMPAFSPTGRQTGLAEEEDFAKLVTELRAGPAPATRELPKSNSPYAAETPAAPVQHKAQDRGEQVKEFFEWAPEPLARLHGFMAKCSRTENPSELREILANVCDQVTLFKLRASVPELRPVWQVATTTEGLLKQLTGRVSNITNSALRTAAGGIELLGDLCKPGIRPDLAANPPIRILAVDDDMVSRYALRAAIVKAFDAPDLAETGAAALAMVKLQRYDLIILDVMMPGMDGFEVCSKIREAAPNSTTPVLFVTALKDFDSRTQFLTTGGNDLLGKPFLTFEIALKALTLAVRARLRDSNRVAEASGASGVSGNPAVAWPSLPAAEVKEEKPASPKDFNTSFISAKNPAAVAALPPPVFAAEVPPAAATPKTVETAPREVTPAFLTYATGQVEEMKKQLKLISGMEENNARRDLVTRLHLTLRSLARKLDVTELRPAFEMCSTLEGLSKKFNENPKNLSDSAVRTATDGLQLLGELCNTGVKADLASEPPIRLLVVDDEPLARRAVTGALQMAFPRPDAVECGESALAMAAEKAFDLVFLDICMPDMDGFTVCTKLHETALNRSTPVVFVTSHSDEQFRAQSARCGGTDYVVKPFAFAEITVKALTFALRGRLEKLKKTPAPDQNK
jgi:DNA-binding response OmpR family regulator